LVTFQIPAQVAGVMIGHFPESDFAGADSGKRACMNSLKVLTFPGQALGISCKPGSSPNNSGYSLRKPRTARNRSPPHRPGLFQDLYVLAGHFPGGFQSPYS